MAGLSTSSFPGRKQPLSRYPNFEPWVSVARAPHGFSPNGSIASLTTDRMGCSRAPTPRLYGYRWLLLLRIPLCGQCRAPFCRAAHDVQA